MKPKERILYKEYTRINNGIGRLQECWGHGCPSGIHPIAHKEIIDELKKESMRRVEKSITTFGPVPRKFLKKYGQAWHNHIDTVSLLHKWFIVKELSDKSIKIVIHYASSREKAIEYFNKWWSKLEVEQMNILSEEEWETQREFWLSHNDMLDFNSKILFAQLQGL